jgi:hypothetical protein
MFQIFNLYSGHGSPCIKTHVTVRETVNMKISGTKICVTKKSLGDSSPACEIQAPVSIPQYSKWNFY